MTDIIRGVSMGLAITFAIVAVVFLVRPVHSQPAIYVPTSFSPASAAAPHYCPPATLSPAPLHGLPRCTP